MFNLLFVFVLVFAIAEWVMNWFDWQTPRWITKPGTMLILLAWFTQQQGWQHGLLWFGLGVIFGLLGDVFLLLPSRYFIPGLLAFLVGHLCYIIGFNLAPLAFNFWMLVIALLVIDVAWLIYKKIKSGLDANPEFSKYKMPVFVYCIVITAMLLSALFSAFRPGWSLLDALVVSLGAVLFFTSDSLLATQRFVAKIPRGNVWVMMTYQLGQIALISGVLLMAAHQ